VKIGGSAAFWVKTAGVILALLVLLYLWGRLKSAASWASDKAAAAVKAVKEAPGKAAEAVTGQDPTTGAVPDPWAYVALMDPSAPMPVEGDAPVDLTPSGMMPSH